MSGHCPSPFYAFYIAPAAVASIATGRLQGMERFAAMAWYSTALALGKIAVALIVLAIGLRVTGIMGALVLSVTALGALGLWWSRDAGSVASGIFSPEVRRAFLALTLFWAVVSMDLPLARAFLSEHDAGIYVAGAVIAMGVLWLPAAVAQICVSARLAHMSSRGEAATRSWHAGSL